MPYARTVARAAALDTLGRLLQTDAERHGADVTVEIAGVPLDAVAGLAAVASAHRVTAGRSVKVYAAPGVTVTLKSSRSPR